MNVKELVGCISREFGYNKAESERILQFILNKIRSELKEGRVVRLRNFGTFIKRKSHGKQRPKFTASKNFLK